jgi:hypothetical protein
MGVGARAKSASPISEQVWKTALRNYGNKDFTHKAQSGAEDSPFVLNPNIMNL